MEIAMLYGELIFYKNDTVIKTIDEEIFSEFNSEQLAKFVEGIVSETGATKAISQCIYHGGADGTINTTLFPVEDT